jgi:hypothetical protein
MGGEPADIGAKSTQMPDGSGRNFSSGFFLRLEEKRLSGQRSLIQSRGFGRYRPAWRSYELGDTLDVQ